jgi:hypothetical protein
MALQNKSLFLTPNESYFLASAILSMLADLRESVSNQKVNWTPEARKYYKDMIQIGEKLSIKLKVIGMDMSKLPEYNPGDENDFLTKES